MFIGFPSGIRAGAAAGRTACRRATWRPSQCVERGLSGLGRPAVGSEAERGYITTPWSDGAVSPRWARASARQRCGACLERAHSMRHMTITHSNGVRFFGLPVTDGLLAAASRDHSWKLPGKPQACWSACPGARPVWSGRSRTRPVRGARNHRMGGTRGESADAGRAANGSPFFRSEAAVPGAAARAGFTRNVRAPFRRRGMSSCDSRRPSHVESAQVGCGGPVLAPNRDHSRMTVLLSGAPLPLSTAFSSGACRPTFRTPHCVLAVHP